MRIKECVWLCQKDVASGLFIFCVVHVYEEDYRNPLEVEEDGDGWFIFVPANIMITCDVDVLTTQVPRPGRAEHGHG